MNSKQLNALVKSSELSVIAVFTEKADCQPFRQLWLQQLSRGSSSCFATGCATRDANKSTDGHFSKFKVYQFP